VAQAAGLGSRPVQVTFDRTSIGRLTDSSRGSTAGFS